MHTSTRRSVKGVVVATTAVAGLALSAAPASAHHKSVQFNRAEVVQACLQVDSKNSKQECNQYAKIVQKNLNKQKHKGAKGHAARQVNQAAIVQLCLQINSPGATQNCNQTAVVIQQNVRIR